MAMAAVADEANVADGKLNILGIFDRINARKLPVVHPHMVFAFRLEAEYIDSDRDYVLRVRLLDEDGRAPFDATGQIHVPPIAPGEFVTASQVFGLNLVEFKRAGRYKFEVRVAHADQTSGEPVLIHETPFHVRHIQQP